MTTAALEGARILVNELVASGLTYAVSAPGSRSGPLALALEEHPDVRLDVTLDERSAAFMALGAARATGKAALVLTTSGTAAANLTPAIHEAHHSRVPLLALTADRPPELRHTGANQTIDQVKLFGDAVRWFVDVEAPAPPNIRYEYLRSIASRAVAIATGSPAGPVHLNVALREPLVAPDEVVLGSRARARDDRWTRMEPSVATLSESGLDAALGRITAATRGVIVCGPSPWPSRARMLAEHLGWPLLADPLSNERSGPTAITTYDALLRNDAFSSRMRPDLVLRVGATGISKALAAWVTTAETHLLVDADGWWLDPDRTLDEVLRCHPAWFFGEARDRIPRSPSSRVWLDTWLDAERIARAAMDETLDGHPLTEPWIARALTDAVPPGSHLVVGASMPFRDVEWYARARGDIRFLGNRGANGIDGFVGTALGVARVSAGRTFALCGDLTLLHDQNALVMRPPDVDLTLVVPNNDGGGIFSFLPQATLRSPFERLFGTPHGREFADLARFLSCEHTRIDEPEDFDVALSESAGVRIVEIRTEREPNVALHAHIQEVISAALDETLSR